MSILSMLKSADSSVNTALWNGYLAYKKRYVATNSVAPIFHFCLAIGGFGMLVQNKTRAARTREFNLHENGRKLIAEAEGRKYVPSAQH